MTCTARLTPARETRSFPFLTWLVLGLLLFALGRANAAAPPELPRAYVDTTYAPPSGSTITVNAGGNLQAALNTAQLGDTIVLQAGATFTGPFTLPKKTTGTGWIYVQSSALASLPPPGTRVTPANAANMPKIVVDNNGTAITTAAGAHHYRFVGIEFKPVAGKFVFNLIDISGSSTVLADLATDITIDRCYIHSDPNVGGRRGVAMNGIRVAVIDSHVSDFKEVGADTQALWTYASPGPLKIVNNYLEAAGENFLAGGAPLPFTNLEPTDIEIRRNHFFKPLAWISQSWTVKNHIELKTGQRVLIEGNVFENNWQAGQNGDSILIVPKGGAGGAPWNAARDITLRYNKFLNVGQGVLISGQDSAPMLGTQRVLIEHNLIQVTRLQGATGRIFTVIASPVDLTIRHNTGLITVSGGTTLFAENSPKADQFDFRDNLLSNGLYGIAGTGTGIGTATLDGHFSNYSFVKNALIDWDGSGPYPAGNFFPANVATVGFVNYGAGDYRLSQTSAYKGAASDGGDVGADIDAIASLTTCVASGTCGSPTSLVAAAPVLSAVAAAPLSASQASVAWITDVPADSQVEYGLTTSYGVATTLASTMVTSHTVGLTGLQAGTVYHYRVKSRDAAGRLSTSGDFTFSTPAASPVADTAAPVISSVAVSAITASQAIIGWTTNEAADTQVEYGHTTSYGSATALNGTLATSHSQSLGGLSASTLYHYRVKSRDAAGNLATSGDFTLTTLAAPNAADTTAPGVPGGLVLSGVKFTRMTLGWNAATDNVGVAGYRLDVATDSGFTRPVVAYQNLDVGNVTSFLVTGLARRTFYYLRLRAYDAAGNVSASSATVSAHTN